MDNPLPAVADVEKPRLRDVVGPAPLSFMRNRLPLVVGITGHRHLDGDAGASEETARGLKAGIKEYFRELQRDCPHTPILVLSPLAEGADQLVAAAALELRDHPTDPLPVELVAPLPMREDLYLDGFEGVTRDDAVAGYQRLKAEASRTIAMPLLSDEADFHDKGKAEEARRLQYLLVGTFVARHCHILLALWDRRHEQGEGGTGQIVRFKRSGRLDLSRSDRSRLEDAPEPYCLQTDPLDTPETGPVAHFLVPGPEGGMVKRPFRRKLLAPQSIDRQEREPGPPVDEVETHEWHQYFNRFNQIYLGNIDEFNQQAEALDRGRAEAVGKGRAGADAWHREGQRALPDASLEECRLPDSLRAVRDTYATADGLAIMFKDRLDRMLNRVIPPILLAVVSFAVYAHLARGFWDAWPLALYLLLLAAADVVYLHGIKGDEIAALYRRLRGEGKTRIRGRDDQNRFQDFRTLAEGLRVQLYWRVAGMGRNAANHYLMRQRNELDWIRSAVRVWGLLADPAAGDEAVQTRRDSLVRRDWVLAQLNYYIRASYRDGVLHLVFWQTAAGFLGVSLLTSLAMAVHELRLDHAPPPLTFAFLGLVTLVAATHIVVKITETAREAGEDQEEITRIDKVARDMKQARGARGTAGGDDDDEEIERAKELPGFMKRLWLLPLYRALGGDDADRPGMRRVSWLSGLYGVLAGGALTLLLAGVSYGLTSAHENGYWTPAHLVHELKDWLIVAVALNVAFAALLQGYTEKRAFGSHYRQYKRMRATFLVAYRALIPQDGSKGLVSPGKVLTSLGKESLAEHADWLLMHRERPMELPKLEL